MWDVDLAHLVNQTLLTGSVRIRASGNPTLLRDDTRKARKKLRGRVAGIAEELREDWEERMDRVTLHAFRHTHETWARALGVDQVLINLQVGWRVSGRANDGFDVMRIASTTGLSRYLDAQSKLLDARKSAIAVRRLLDEGPGAHRPRTAEPRQRPECVVLHGASPIVRPRVTLLPAGECARYD